MQVLGLAPQKGSLDYGADADFLFLDPKTVRPKLREAIARTLSSGPHFFVANAAAGRPANIHWRVLRVQRRGASSCHRDGCYFRGR